MQELTGKSKEMSVNLHIEQEAHAKCRLDKEALERECVGLREDIEILKQGQS